MRQIATDVVAALIWDQDKFMICQRPANKARGLLWEFVGGKVEPGEAKEQALIRECREELAITLDVGEVFMDVVHEYPDLTVHLTLFHATIREGIPQKLEHNDIRWIMGNGVRQGLNYSEFSRLMVFEPQYEEQVAIANFLDTKVAEIDGIIEQKREQLEVLDSYKKSLIYEYVTGKKEVI